MTNYFDVRSKVRDADIAFFSGDTFLAKAIQRVTKSPINHCGLLFWDGDHLMLHEAVAEGCRAIRLSRKLETCTKPVVIARSRHVDSEAKRYAIRRESNYLLAVEYNTWSLVQIWFRVRLGIGRKPRFQRETICSEMIAQAYRRAGYEFTGTQGFVSPASIYADPLMFEIGRIEPQCELEEWVPT